MSYDANVLRRATQRLEEERRARADRADRARAQAYAKQPRLEQIDRELQGIDEEAVNAHILEEAKKLWGALNHCEY